MSPDIMLNIIKIAGLFVVVSFVVFWVGLVWWVSQDVLTRTKDKIIVSAAVALTAILGPVGVLIYLVVRPRQTLKERFGEMMEQEMMLQASAITICPTCERMAQDDFVACPHCGTILKKPCVDCGKLLAMDWDHCPFCGVTQQVVEIVETIEVAQATQPSASESIEIVSGVPSKSVMAILRDLLLPPINPAQVNQPATESIEAVPVKKHAPKKHKPSSAKSGKGSRSSAKKS